MSHKEDDGAKTTVTVDNDFFFFYNKHVYHHWRVERFFGARGEQSQRPALTESMSLDITFSD